MKMIFNLEPVQHFLTYSTLLLVFYIGWTMKHLSFLKRAIEITFVKFSGIFLPPEVYWESLFGWEMFASFWHFIKIDWNRKIKLYQKALDIPVVVLDENGNEKRASKLLEQATRNRPLVLNFGSHTCPVFTSKLAKFCSMLREFEDIADFALVYIEEAHPTDGWALQGDINITTHRSLDERCAAARSLQERFNPGCPILVDSMLNTGNTVYGASPIRLHVVQNGVLVYEGGAGPFHYDMDELRDWLVHFQNDSKLK